MSFFCRHVIELSDHSASSYISKFSHAEQASVMAYSQDTDEEQDCDEEDDEETHCLLIDTSTPEALERTFMLG
uniref:Uncharacterized protein n=1 Tax=Ditylenchus dipsaci TaxID=166011 RepID=A0A915E9T6_9BILA